MEATHQYIKRTEVKDWQKK